MYGYGMDQHCGVTRDLEPRVFAVCAELFKRTRFVTFHSKLQARSYQIAAREARQTGYDAGF